MNKRYCKLGKYAAQAFFLIALSGSFQACKDDYSLDDTNPSWLGSSIYEYLNEEGNYTNFVKLIDDLNYKEVLARTGSKTLFVADDAAFDEFYKNNAWSVHSYSELSNSQKKLLMNSAMINNAYLLEMMSSTPAGSGDNDLPVKGEALRRETASDVTDSVPHLFSKDIPHSYNKDDIDYWARFRNDDKGIYIANDASTPMMTHFLAAQMAAQKITDKDFELLTGRKRSKNDAFVYDSKVTKADITCQNGYVNLLDKVLLFPQNMAEVLRTNEQTQIFSHMIDRFSAPFYNSDLTERYRLIYGNKVDSVFQKRYFAERSQGGTSLFSDAGTDPVGNPTGNTIFNSNSNKPLPFDPGWNTYFVTKTDKAQDMAAIFCPTDEKLMEYFFGENGGGRFLVKAYAPDLLSQITPSTSDKELVYQAIDQIPRATIRALLNNLMKESFNSTVPSKFESIKNSAQDAMFDEKDDYHRNKLIKTLLANNGVIYLMDEVTTPAEYAAVSAPAYVETDKHIFNWAVQSAKLGGIPSNYYAYLLAMSSRFSFLVPSDDNFWYVDPLSFYAPTKETDNGSTVLVGRAYNYTWDAKKNTPKVASYKYEYDCTTKEGVIGELLSTETISETCFGNRLKDMLETHTIIHEDNSEITGIDETATGVECAQHYFVTKNGAVIKVDDASKRTNGMTVQGGWQITNGEKMRVTGFDDKSAQTNGYGNGFAYMIDKPLTPTIESVYSVMYNNPNFSKFFELCQTDDEVLKELGITSTTEKNKYQVFVNNKGLPCYDNTTGNIVNSATNVRFFNNYRYTVYIPTNEAMKQAEKAGLPTWQHLRDILELDVDPEDRKDLSDEQVKERNEKLKAAVTEIINFVKNHFQDNSVFADEPARHRTVYETATIVTTAENNDEESTGGGTGVYCKVYVSSTGNGTLDVTDATGATHHITNDKNIIARDYVTDGKNNAKDNRIVSSSSAVIHGIDGVLNYRKLENGRYDTAWSTVAKAKKYLKKYKLTK